MDLLSLMVVGLWLKNCGMTIFGSVSSNERKKMPSLERYCRASYRAISPHRPSYSPVVSALESLKQSRREIFEGRIKLLMSGPWVDLCCIHDVL